MNVNLETLMTRKSECLVGRETQLHYNQLANQGGREYIDRRLWRAPNESELSWNGNSIQNGGRKINGFSNFGVVGRRERTTLVNDASRITTKIQQYIFSKPVARGGASEEFLKNMGGRGVDALTFWMNANEVFTTSQWLFIQVVKPSVANTLADKSKENQVFWQIFPSTSVPDFYINSLGELEWLITESLVVEKPSPFVKPTKKIVRSLWQKKDGKVAFSQYSKNADNEVKIEQAEVLIDIDELPFVLIGNPNSKTWWYDDVEAIQAQMLNMDSLHIDNLVRCVFPQLVISVGTYESLNARLVERYGAEQGQVIVELVKEIVRGVDSPIIESAEESGITRFICPSTQELNAFPTEIERKRKLLFDITGLSLFNKESRQVQSAESKQFDQLDTECTLVNRSMIMQTAEEKLVALSKKIDSTFDTYKPIWASSFDVVDAQSDIQVITTLSNMADITPSMRKLLMKSGLRVVESIASTDKELIAKANKEIDELDFGDAINPNTALIDFNGNDSE